jgi:hypothetical protein
MICNIGKKAKRSIRSFNDKTFVEGRLLFIQSFLVFSIAALIVILAPDQSIDKN